MSEGRLLMVELLGAVFTIILGSLLHFLYDWSGKWPPLAIFAAVNESVWEHMKIAFWPALIFAVMQFFLMGERPADFLFAKTVNFYLLAFLIPFLYYAYTALTGKNYLVVDILIFVVAAVIAHLVSYKLMAMNLPAEWNYYAVVPLMALLAAFSLFTLYPPHFELFQSPHSDLK